jgi:hypothetical protein
MVQATLAIVFPVPRFREGRWFLTTTEYHLAELICLSKTELDRYLDEAKISVIR